MLDKSLKYLVYIHSTLCTHADMKKLFLPEDVPSYEEVWEWLKSGTLELDTTEERNKKIKEKLNYEFIPLEESLAFHVENYKKERK